MTAKDYALRLKSNKDHPDEFNILLASKFLRANIMVLTLHKDWQMYEMTADYGYVLGYKGKIDDQGKWVTGVHYNTSVSRSK